MVQQLAQTVETVIKAGAIGVAVMTIIALILVVVYIHRQSQLQKDMFDRLKKQEDRHDKFEEDSLAIKKQHVEELARLTKVAESIPETNKLQAVALDLLRQQMDTRFLEVPERVSERTNPALIHLISDVSNLSAIALTYKDELAAKQDQSHSVLTGLRADISQIPAHIREQITPVLTEMQAIHGVLRENHSTVQKILSQGDLLMTQFKDAEIRLLNSMVRIIPAPLPLPVPAVASVGAAVSAETVTPVGDSPKPSPVSGSDIGEAKV